MIAGGLAGVRWDLLSDAAKGPTVWAALARKMGPQALRMNLNTLLRHGVFNVATSLRDADSNNVRPGDADLHMVDYVADRIADELEIRASKQFPYQFFAAYLNADDNVQQKIKTALHKAAEIACGNVPELPGPVVIGLDTSGSMSSAVTGQRYGRGSGRGATSKMRCIDLQPYQTVQACERADIMNIGGFSDAVFTMINAFLADNNQRFVDEVDAIEL